MKAKLKVAPTAAPDEATATAARSTQTTAPNPRTAITPREQSAIIKSLAAGLVPKIGLEHLVVGRRRETQALLGDLGSIKDGGATFRLIVGVNGAGKTFSQRLIQGQALQENIVVLSADLTVNHRLHA